MVYKLEEKEKTNAKDNMLRPGKKYELITEELTPNEPSLPHGQISNGRVEKLKPLDPNHSHFILVDNGTNMHGKTEIELRIGIEGKMDTMWEDSASMSFLLVQEGRIFFKPEITKIMRKLENHKLSKRNTWLSRVNT